MAGADLKKRGNAMFGKRRFSDAVELYEAAIAQSSAPGELAALLALRSAAWLKLGREEVALGDAQRAVELDPQSAKAHLRLGQALHAHGEGDRAVEAMRAVLKLNPKDFDAAAALAEWAPAIALPPPMPHAASASSTLFADPTSPAIMVVASRGGMCNQLRVALSYRTVARERQQPLFVLWNKDSAACPAGYDELFEPLDGMHVVTSTQQLIEQLPPAYRTGRTHDSIVRSTTDATHPAVLGTERETHMYAELQPLPSVRAAVIEAVRACGVPFAAVHIRRTDHQFPGQTADAEFVLFLNKHAPLPIFCATDNGGTLRAFRDKFAGRIRHVQPIHEPTACELSASSCAREFRHTSVRRAAVDLWTCVEASVFKGSYFSSFSDTIARLRAARGLANETDEHNTTLPGWLAPPPPPQQDDSIALQLLRMHDGPGTANAACCHGR